MKNTLSSLLPLAPLVIGITGCPKSVDFTPPEGPTKVYDYGRSDGATDSTGETVYIDTNIHGTDPYKIPGYSAVSEKQEAVLLAEMSTTVQRIEKECDLDLSRPQKNEIQIHYDRPDCQNHWKMEAPSCINPSEFDRYDCERKEIEFFDACNSLTNSSHEPNLFMVIVAYPELSSSAATCVEGIQAEKRCTVQSNGIILEEFTDSGEFERGLRVICKDLESSQ